MQNRRVRLYVAGLALAATCCAVAAQDLKRLSAVADQLAKDNRYSGTVLVAAGERVLLDRGYGEANAEWGIHNTPATRFRLGSITKQFTAASVLLLQERGKCKLTDTVGQYLPDAPPAWRPVTIQQLLTHTSGIHSFTDIPQYAAMERFARTPAEILAAVRDRPLDFVPGSRFDYSNSGYVLLGMLIEKLSGDRYAQFVQKNIFDALGMKDSGYDSNAALIPRRAAGYRDNGGQRSNADYIHMSIPFAAGALYSTTGDLLRWQRALYEGKLLSRAAVQAMTTPFQAGYALGLVVQDGPDGRQFGHGGGIEGFSTQIAYRPDEHISVILLSNVEGSHLEPMVGTLFQVVRGKKVVLASERRQVKLAPERLRQLAGLYGSVDGSKFWFKVDGGQASVRHGGQPWLPVFAESDDHFFSRTGDAQMEVVRLAGGQVEALILRQNGGSIRVQPIADVAPAYEAQAFFVRGDMNDWGISDPMRKLSDHAYAATLTLAAQRYTFKLGSEDFKAIDFGAFHGDETIRLDQAMRLDAVGENMQIDIVEPGDYLFTLDTADARVPPLSIQRRDNR